MIFHFEIGVYLNQLKIDPKFHRMIPRTFQWRLSWATQKNCEKPSSSTFITLILYQFRRCFYSRRDQKYIMSLNTNSSLETMVICSSSLIIPKFQAFIQSHSQILITQLAQNINNGPTIVLVVVNHSDSLSNQIGD